MRTNHRVTPILSRVSPGSLHTVRQFCEAKESSVPMVLRVLHHVKVFDAPKGNLKLVRILHYTK